MKNVLKLTLAAALLFSSTHAAVAEQCITQGSDLNRAHSLYSTSLDPYAHLLPDLGQVDSLATSYDLQLKPFVVNDLNRLQFNTYDSRSPAAGYTSPYLWDVGQGPGYRSPYGNWGGPRPGQSGNYSPVPMPVRR